MQYALKNLLSAVSTPFLIANMLQIASWPDRVDKMSSSRIRRGFLLGGKTKQLFPFSSFFFCLYELWGSLGKSGKTVPLITSTNVCNPDPMNSEAVFFLWLKSFPCSQRINIIKLCLLCKLLIRLLDILSLKLSQSGFVWCNGIKH